MPQIFPRYANFLSRASLFGSVLGGASLLWIGILYARSSYGTGAGIARVQPVPFSHEHHVGVLGYRLPILSHHGRAVLPTPGFRPPRPA